MKLKINWAIPGLLAMLLIIAAVAAIQTVSAISPDPAKLATQCSACHAMDDHVASWQASAHKDVACTECHADPGAWGWVEMQLGHLRMVTAAKSGAEVDLSKVATAVPNQRCLDCHSRQMPWVMQDLQPPELDENGEPIRVAAEELQHFPALAGHDLHLTLDQPLNCTECHSGVSHGPQEKEEQVQTWHDTCMNCHAEEKVAMPVRTAITCSACHTDLTLVSPEDHQRPDFRTLHGQQAAAEIQSCQQCHLTPGLAELSPGAEPPAAAFQPVTASQPHPTIPAMLPGSIAVTEGMEDACAACHGVTMPHPEGWLTQHSEGFKEKPELCASCHGTRDQGFAMEILGDPRTLSSTDATCTGCHAQPMPHPDGWLAGAHQAQALSSPQTCVQCHSSQNPANPVAAHASPQFCADCHLNRFAHPASFIVSHGSVALAADGQSVAADCATCHTPTVNSCTECHTDGIGKGVEQDWHPDSWIATHGKVALTAAGEIAANCATCHTESFNSCAQCHTEGFAQSGKAQWHPEGWVADHKAVALGSDGQVAASCTSCHSESFKACTDCHSAGIGTGVRQEWHPPMFWVSHARTTRPEDIGDCKSCHNYVEPSCAKCHREY